MSKYDVLTSIHKQFRQAAKELCSETKNVGQKDAKNVKQNFKSSAQVESSVAPHVAHSVAHVVAPHSAGSFPEPQCKKSYTHGLRLREGELDIIRGKAQELNMSVNAYIRASVLGAGYVSAIDPAKRQLLINIQSELNKQGSNLNQIAKHLNAGILNPYQGKDHLSLLARSLLNAHTSVRQALSEGRTME